MTLAVVPVREAEDLVFACVGEGDADAAFSFELAVPRIKLLLGVEAFFLSDMGVGAGEGVADALRTGRGTEDVEAAVEGDVVDTFRSRDVGEGTGIPVLPGVMLFRG